MASVDYTGRQVDLLIFQGVAAEGDQQVRMDIASEAQPGGEVIAGIGKVCQSFALTFLTDVGSIKYDPNFGTEFVGEVRNQRIRGDSDVQAFFGLAEEAVRRILQLAAENTELPDDEIYAGAELRSFTIDRDTATLTMFVRVSSLAGATREVLLPVPLAIQ